MRILCLHGKGTSGAIFKSQTSSVRTQLAPLNLDFDFVDGPIPSSPASGIDLFYSPPYYSWWEGESAEAIKAARQWLKTHIILSGPYDAVMMFSQGCTLGSSALLLNALEEPRSPPLFKAAIFICGGPPLAVAESLGYKMTPEMRERDSWSRAALAQQADSSAILNQGAARWKGGWWDILDEVQLRNEMEFPWKIEIPTVHIYGNKDPRYLAGVQLSALFDTDNMKTYAHDGGHEIPRKTAVSRKIAELVRWVLESA